LPSHPPNLKRAERGLQMHLMWVASDEHQWNVL
jgi:hypothetical protein